MITTPLILIVSSVLTLANRVEGYLDVKPEWLKTCVHADPKFEDCSTESIQGLFDQLAYGIDGIADSKVDPLKISKIRVLQGEGPVSLNATLSNVVVKGFGKTTVLRSQVSRKDYSWVTRILVPKMRLDANYLMQGRILVLPLNGRGKLWFEPENLNVTLYTKTTLYEEGNHVFYNVTSTRSIFEMGGLKLRLGNLFDGVKELEEGTNAYLNENWRAVSDAIKPIIGKTIEDILLQVLKRIFSQLPAEFLISDIARPSERTG